jgi:hypothetical protein
VGEDGAGDAVLGSPVWVDGDEIIPAFLTFRFDELRLSS